MLFLALEIWKPGLAGSAACGPLLSLSRAACGPRAACLRPLVYKISLCHLVFNTVELFFGSSSNVPVLMHWLLLVCAQNPERVQARIQKEVDDVVGRDRQPTWEDRKAMPFTMASVLEITRWKVTEPIGLPRG
ncbi:conserved hypothetical protein [Ixodes scapularis]|uniref:Cytochrome P450 n=1 Tax=Ixodes scapularis TaxID=6945 RepID=B7PVI4_IXOSC|nr:conserved hypothetical protein [Ixodes scapularis]|eukprot:XP_002408055.1 conserved hypothetical protein [Ixodes scapularis]